MNGGVLCSGKENDVGSYSGDTPGVTFPGTGFAADTRGIKTGTDFAADTRGIKTSTDFSADTRGVKTGTDFSADTRGVKTGLQCFPLPPLLSCRSWQGSFFPISHLTIAGKTL